MSEYLGDGRFRTLAGTEYVVTVNRRIVDATYLRAVVPSMRPAPYSVAPGVDCVAPNELPKLGTGIATWSSVPARPAWTSAYGCSKRRLP